MKTLKEVVGNTFNPNLKLEPRVAKERKIFNDTSVPKELFKNIYSDSEYDALFKGSNVKQTAREAERHGYSLGNDAKVYEDVFRSFAELYHLLPDDAPITNTIRESAGEIGITENKVLKYAAKFGTALKTGAKDVARINAITAKTSIPVIGGLAMLAHSQGHHDVAHAILGYGAALHGIGSLVAGAKGFRRGSKLADYKQKHGDDDFKAHNYLKHMNESRLVRMMEKFIRETKEEPESRTKKLIDSILTKHGYDTTKKAPKREWWMTPAQYNKVYRDAQDEHFGKKDK